MAKLKSHFLLDPSVTFLNFGSFGACPKPVFEEYQKWQLQLEKEPVQFMMFKSTEYLAHAREALAAYLHCKAEDVVYVTNPSYAVNIVAKSLDLKEGDEILTTNLEYGACEKTWEYVCAQSGAKLVRQPVSLPVTIKENVVRELFRGATERTRLLFVSHITSATALILPVKEIVAEARKRGIMTFVDGAHAPGQLPVDLTAINADIYTGACHKWMMAPKGSSFLHVQKDHQSRFGPLVVSWGYSKEAPAYKRFIDWHQGQGTRDLSAFLTVPAAIKFMKDQHWEKIAANSRQLANDNARHFCNLLDSAPIAPADGTFTGQMFSFRVNTSSPEGLQHELFTRYHIEIPVMRQAGHSYLRYSINGFNDQEDLDKLYDALKELKKDGKHLH